MYRPILERDRARRLRREQTDAEVLTQMEAVLTEIQNRQ
jgi:hypothetical protein